MIVFGSLRLSNGQKPGFVIEIPLLKGQLEDTSSFSCICKILGGVILVEFTEGFQEEKIIVDEVFRITRHIIDNLILSQVAIEGIGVSYTLEFCKIYTGEVIYAQPDLAPQIADIQLNYQDLFELIGRKFEIRYAIRDFNQGLIDRENCPFLFHRAIETLAKVVCNQSELSKKDWDKFTNVIGSTSDEVEELLQMKNKISHPHRHGNHIFFTREQHLKMLKTVRVFLSRSIQFLLAQEQNK